MGKFVNGWSTRHLRARYILVVLSLAILFLNSCGGGGNAGTPTPSASPIAVTVSPSSINVVVGATEQFSATVSNSSNTSVTWSVNSISGGNSTVGTISGTGLYTAPAVVPSAGSVSVQATSQADPTKSGSATVSLTYPVPSLKSITPDTAAVGSAAATLTVQGSGFTPASVVSLDGKSLVTTFVATDQLTVTLSEETQALAGTHSIKVTNPSPGGGTTSGTNFTVDNLAPQLNSLSPSTVPVGNTATRVTLIGANFISDSQAQVDSTALVTTYVSASQLVATVPAQSLASAGTISITVSNPSPGGGSSSEIDLTVGNTSGTASGDSTAQQSAPIDTNAFTYVVGLLGAPSSTSAVQKQQVGSESSNLAQPEPASVTVSPCNFDSATQMSGSACIGQVPWLFQMPPGTNSILSANCGTAAYLMVRDYFEHNDDSECASQSQSCLDFATPAANEDTSPSAEEIIRLLQWVDPGPEDDPPAQLGAPSPNPAPDPADSPYQDVQKQISDDSISDCGNTSGHACLYYDNEYYGPKNGWSLSTLEEIANDDPFVARIAHDDTMTDSQAITDLHQQLANGPIIILVRYKMRQWVPLDPTNPSSSGTCEKGGVAIPDSNYGWCSGHYMVLVGMDYDPNNVLAGRVYVNDPFYPSQLPSDQQDDLVSNPAKPGEYLGYLKSDFLKSWRSAPLPWNGRNSAYLVITPKTAKLSVSTVDQSLTFPGAQVGVNFNSTVATAFGTPPFTFSVLPGGNVPPGISVDSNTGTISGIPQEAGLFQFTLQVADSTPSFVDAPVSITVGSNQVPLTITTPANLPSAEVAVPYQQQLTAASGMGTYHWSLSGSSLPDGLSLSSNGVISGTPNQDTPGTTFTVKVSDSGTTVQTATKSLTLAIGPSDLPPQISFLNATPTSVNPGGTSTLQCQPEDAGDGSLTYTWSVTGGTLTGTGPTTTWNSPTTPGTYSATCSISNTNGQSSPSTIYLSVVPAGLTATISPTTGVAATTQFSVTGNGATANGSVTATITLPDGTTSTSHATADANGAFTFSPFTEIQPGTYTETDADDSTGAKSNVLVWTVTPTGVVNVTPDSWNPVFTVGDAAATIGFYITNQSGGSLTGTIAASTTSGGQWLTAAGHASYNWVAPETVNVSADPSGLSAGSYAGTLTVTSPNPPSTVTIPVTMTIYNPLQITTTSLPDAVSGQPYSVQLQASGGTGTGNTWSLVSGTLPVGISFSSSGLLSGTVGSLSGSTTETLKIAVQDADGHQAISTFSLLWREGLAILPYSPSNFEFTVGSAYTSSNSIVMQAAGGTPPYSWSATGMPPGLTIASSTGLISGTPMQAGSFTANVKVTDSTGQSTTAPVTFTVVLTPLAVTTGTLPSGTVGVSYSQFVNAQGGSQSGYSWTVQGNLPPGLTANSPTGGSSTAGLQISGIPTQAGTFTFTAIVTDSLKDTAQQSVTVVINSGSPPQITTNTLTLATVGESYSFALTATGGAGGYKWLFVGSSPDSGLQLSTSGVLTGTSTVANDCPSGPDIWVGTNYPSKYFQVQVTDAAGQSAVRQLCLPAFYATPQITSLSPPSMTINGQQQTITINGTGFRNDAYVYNAANVTTYVSSTALEITLAPTNPIVTDTTLQFWVVQPYSQISNKVNFTIYDPAPTVSGVTAVLNNSTQPCTANSNCQLVVTGGGLVYDTSYVIAETGQALSAASYPSTPIPWNTVTTSAFSLPAGTYTLEVTNPNQTSGGSATAVATFTVQ